MNATDIINELPNLTDAERCAVFVRLVELEDAPLSSVDEALVEQRLAAHRADAGSSVPLEEVKRRLARRA